MKILYKSSKIGIFLCVYFIPFIFTFILFMFTFIKNMQIDYSILPIFIFSIIFWVILKYYLVYLKCDENSFYISFFFKKKKISYKDISVVFQSYSSSPPYIFICLKNGFILRRIIITIPDVKFKPDGFLYNTLPPFWKNQRGMGDLLKKKASNIPPTSEP